MPTADGRAGTETVTLDPRPSDAELLSRLARLHVAEGRSITHAQADAATSAPIEASRLGDSLRLTIRTAPRTKKNHREMVFSKKQRQLVPIPSKSYETYKREVVLAVSHVGAKLGLPLPDQPYNIDATFTCDKYGQRADLDGLLAGLFDALQAAGVVTDDYWFRQADGTRVLAVRKNADPQIAVVITPITLELHA